MGYDMYWAIKPTDEERAAAADDDLGYFRLNIWGMAATRQAMFDRGMLVYLLPREALSAEGSSENNGVSSGPDLATLSPWSCVPFPDPRDFGLESEPKRFDETDEEIEYPEGSPESLYLEAYRETFVSDSRGPIPIYKLMTNDGWLVTPEEIARSFERYDLLSTAVAAATTGAAPTFGNRRHAETVDELGIGRSGDIAADLPIVHLPWDEKATQVTWWPEWIAWLKAATDRGGFHVW